MKIQRRLFSFVWRRFLNKLPKLKEEIFCLTSFFLVTFLALKPLVITDVPFI